VVYGEKLCKLLEISKSCHYSKFPNDYIVYLGTVGKINFDSTIIFLLLRIGIVQKDQ